MTARRGLLAVAVLAYVAWVTWLAMQTGDVKGPIVSRSQVAVANVLVKAELSTQDDGRPAVKIVVVEMLICSTEGTSPKKGDEIELANLPGCRGFAGPGEYLVVLERLKDGYRLRSSPRSPGYAEGQPWVYPWSESVEKQVSFYVAG